MPFGFQIAPDTLPSGTATGSRFALAVSGFRLRARLGFSIPTCFPGQRGITPAFGYGAPHPSAEGTSTPLTHALPSAHYELLRPYAPHRSSHPCRGRLLALLPSQRSDRFPRSVQEPNSKSRRLHAGCRLGGNQAIPQTDPGLTTPPGFDIVHTLSTRHQRFACARLFEPQLTGSRPAFSATLTTTAFDRRSLRWFEACPSRPASRDCPHLLRSKAASSRPCYIRASSSRRRGAPSSAYCASGAKR